MANYSEFQGLCPAPFMDMSLFPSTGGYIGGRLCSQLPEFPGSPTCCAPCPVQDLLFPHSFTNWNTAAQWVNVASLALLIFLTLSYICLPPDQTRRHYLSVSIMAPFIMLTLGFVIPLATQPDKCYNEITPNDMYSSMPCAWNGAFLLAGALGVSMWIFLRALYMHIQICWDMNPGQKFFYASQIFGWGVPAAFFVATITLTGVSFRLGNQCLINHQKSVATFWGPLISISGLALLLQIATFIYCCNVYLRNYWTDEKSQSELSSLPTYSSSMRPTTTRAVYRRMIKLLRLQWRGIVNVVILVVDVVAFGVVFLQLDRAETHSNLGGTKEQAWGFCLILNQGDASKCYKQAASFLTSETTVVVILMMVALAGIETVFLFFHWSIFTGWRDLFKSFFTSQSREFVSLDAISPPQPNYMLNRLPQKSELQPTPTWQTPDDVFKEAYTSIDVMPTTPGQVLDRGAISPDYREYSRSPQDTPDYFHRNNSIRTFQSINSMNRPGSSTSQTERPYQAPRRSFSAPRSPTMSRQTMEHADLRSLGARGGLGLHPPIEDDRERQVEEVEEMRHPSSFWDNRF